MVVSATCQDLVTSHFLWVLDTEQNPSAGSGEE